MNQKTKDKILEAATALFAAQGYAGASISQIAQQAGINQSLIYHHIGNKKDLWHAVKSHLLNAGDSLQLPTDTAMSMSQFIQKTLEERLQTYESDPRILRILQWQMLEDNPQDLIGTTHLSPAHWVERLKQLQDETTTNTPYPPEFIATLMYGAIHSLLMDPFNTFKRHPHKKKDYIQMIRIMLDKIVSAP